MTRDVMIGNVTVPMAADAFTPIHFHSVFKEDLFKLTDNFGADEFGADTYLLYGKLAFILAKRAEGAKMSALTPEEFEDWFSGFEFVDMTEAIFDVADLYAASKKGTSSPKP